MTAITVDIVSDTVCPWCYVGHKRLSRAISSHLQSHPSTTFDVHWHPYQLGPDAPYRVSEEKRSFYKNKFGEARAQSIFSTLNSVGTPEGIHFSFGGRTGNTLDSHRVIAMAGEKEKEAGGQDKSGRGLQTAVVEKFFNMYFENEGDITNVDNLVQKATEAGMNKKDVESLMAGESLKKEVATEVAKAQMGGVSGVPNFRVNGCYELGGAREPEEFLKVFERIEKEGK
ncbi:MAG: hypothetical protein Q9162_007888 [Coniocarpon cinnabarinum]